MKTGDILLLALIGAGVYLIFRSKSISSLFPPMVAMPATPAPLFFGPRCPPGQFVVHSGPLGMGPGQCTSQIPAVLS